MTSKAAGGGERLNTPEIVEDVVDGVHVGYGYTLVLVTHHTVFASALVPPARRRNTAAIVAAQTKRFRAFTMLRGPFIGPPLYDECEIVLPRPTPTSLQLVPLLPHKQGPGKSGCFRLGYQYTSTNSFVHRETRPVCATPGVNRSSRG